MKRRSGARAFSGGSRLFRDGLVAVVTVAALLAAVGAGHSTLTKVPSGAPAATAYVGTVTGGISPCEGIPIPGPKYAAGTVEVLRGTLGWRSIGPGSWTIVFPTQAVATQVVGVDRMYSFRLEPGQYVLVGHYPPPANVTPWVQMTVRAGEFVSADIPNMCK